ncbi:MAG: hypothetical protein JWO38_234 [Gemmataceae bacterium]|nr:hypothetical protein [Gemmataceae bacterium]
MTPAAPPRPPARLAADVARPLTLSDEAKALLTPTATARQFFDTLAAAPLPDDAIRFLAAALPKREAVWWGHTCLVGALPKPLPESAARALAAAEKWVKDPSEANRRAAGDAADLAGHGAPAGCLAAGAFWSGGSLAPPNLPPVPPRDDLTGQAVAGALFLAVAGLPAPAAARQRFLAAGADIASGRVKV